MIQLTYSGCVQDLDTLQRVITKEVVRAGVSMHEEDDQTYVVVPNETTDDQKAKIDALVAQALAKENTPPLPVPDDTWTVEDRS